MLVPMFRSFLSTNCQKHFLFLNWLRDSSDTEMRFRRFFTYFLRNSGTKPQKTEFFLL